MTVKSIDHNDDALRQSAVPDTMRLMYQPAIKVMHAEHPTKEFCQTRINDHDDS